MLEKSKTNHINQRFNITTVFFHFQVGQNPFKAAPNRRRLNNNSQEVRIENFSQTIDIVFPNLKQGDQTARTNTYKISMAVDKCTPLAIFHFILYCCKRTIFFLQSKYT